VNKSQEKNFLNDPHFFYLKERLFLLPKGEEIKRRGYLKKFIGLLLFTPSPLPAMPAAGGRQTGNF